MIFEYVKTSWDAYKQNFMSFILASLILWIIPSVIALTGIGIVLGSVGISAFTEMFNQRIMLSRIVYFIPLMINMSVLSIFFIIAGLVYVFLLVGMFGMAAQSLRGKTNFWTIFKFAKNKGLTGILAFVIIGIMSFFIFLIIVLGLEIIFPFYGTITGIIIFSLVIILFSLTFPGIVLDNLNTLESIKISVNIVKRNYIEMLSLLLVYLALSILITFIPIVGLLIVAFVIFPMLCITLVVFYKKRK